jgi:hypothetical protein
VPDYARIRATDSEQCGDSNGSSGTSKRLPHTALSQHEIEAAFGAAYDYLERRDGSIEMLAETPSGRCITIIWRYDREDDEIPDVFGDPPESRIFVITAYWIEVMVVPAPDDRSPERKALDEQIAAEPPIAWADIPPGAKPQSIEALMASRRRPIAVAGIVENGLVRPLDPAVHLPEHSRMIIVAAER